MKTGDKYVFMGFDIVESKDGVYISSNPDYLYISGEELAIREIHKKFTVNKVYIIKMQHFMVEIINDAGEHYGFNSGDQWNVRLFFLPLKEIRKLKLENLN